MATFTDNTSSNGMSNNWVAEVEYTTTGYDGYTRVNATLYLTVKYGWSFTLNNGYSLTINGSTVSGNTKKISQSSGTTKYTLLTHSVDVYHTTNQEITISGWIDASNIYYQKGDYNVGTYSLSQNVTLIPNITKCNPPTSITVSPTSYEDKITVTWSGASGGTNNAITGYDFRVYLANETNTGWVWDTHYDCNGIAGSLTHIASTSTSGSQEFNLSWIPRGRHATIKIITTGKPNYYSALSAQSNTFIRIPYTACSQPTTFTVALDSNLGDGFDTQVTVTWSGANGGTNNTIASYLIRYRTSNNNSTWGNWADLQAPSTTLSYGTLTIDMSSKVQRGHYVQFAIQTKGSAGSGYYSDYTYSDSVQRSPYGKCTAPTNITLLSESDVNNVKHNDIFNSKVTISWSGATSGDNNSIARYYIEYCTSSNNSTWSNWISLQSSNLTPAGTTSTTVDISAKVDRGCYIKFQIRAEGSAGSSYYSAYKQSGVIKRNSLPNAPSTFTIGFPTSLEYSAGDSIVLDWDNIVDNDNNLKYYQLQATFTTQGVWSDWTNVDTYITPSNTSYTLLPTSALYKQVGNNEKIQFRLRTYDDFGEASSYVTSVAVTRYDITGIAIGINDKWINCQIYVGTNGSWVEQDVCAGINNGWIETNKA